MTPPAIRWPTPAHALPDDTTAALVASALAYHGEHPSHGPGEFAECAEDGPSGYSWVTGDAAGWLASTPAFPAWCAMGAAAGNVEDFDHEWPADEAAIASAELEAACFVFAEVTR